MAHQTFIMDLLDRRLRRTDRFLYVRPSACCGITVSPGLSFRGLLRRVRYRNAVINVDDYRDSQGCSSRSSRCSLFPREDTHNVQMNLSSSIPKSKLDRKSQRKTYAVSKIGFTIGEMQSQLKKQNISNTLRISSLWYQHQRARFDPCSNALLAFAYSVFGAWRVSTLY